MTKKTIAISLSVLVAIMPFLGFPEQFKTYFFIVSGLLLAGLIEMISIQYRKEYGRLISREEELDRYEDSYENEKDSQDEEVKNEESEEKQ